MDALQTLVRKILDGAKVVKKANLTERARESIDKRDW